jgi:hypothetical protein
VVWLDPCSWGDTDTTSAGFPWDGLIAPHIQTNPTPYACPVVSAHRASVYLSSYATHPHQAHPNKLTVVCITPTGEAVNDEFLF